MAGSSIYFANSPEGARTFMWARSLVGPPGAMVDGWNGPLEQVDSFRFQIPRSYKPQMRTSGLIFVDQPMIPQLRQDRAPEQVANVATMPGIVGMAMAMPDIHWGYGFPIGGVAAFDYDAGVISPGGIGYDINCGVRLIRTDLTEADVRPHLRALTDACFKNVPSGVGEGGLVKVSRQDLAKLATDGVGWSVEKGYAWPEDVDHIEAEGHLPDADFSRVGDRAIARGKDQVGSLGAGNHFVEIQKVDRVYDARAAKAFGIDSVGTVCIMVHTGSRGFGHQIASDYIEACERVVKREKIELPDLQLACAPIGSSGQGAGRQMARKAAARTYDANEVVRSLEKRGIYLRAASRAGIVEEAPGAYKNVEDVVRVAEGAGLTKIVARMVPLGVVKG